MEGNLPIEGSAASRDSVPQGRNKEAEANDSAVTADDSAVVPAMAVHVANAHFVALSRVRGLHVDFTSRKVIYTC